MTDKSVIKTQKYPSDHKVTHTTHTTHTTHKAVPLRIVLSAILEIHHYYTQTVGPSEALLFEHLHWNTNYSATPEEKRLNI